MGEFTDGILSPHNCGAAAAALAEQSVAGLTPADDVAALLSALGYLAGDGAGPADPSTRANRQALLQLAARLRRLFALSPPDAPNLLFLGAEADPGAAGLDGAPAGTVSLAGAGLSFGEAFERCVGEGAEYLSQIASDADIVDRARPSDCPHRLPPAALSEVLAMVDGNLEAADPEIDWVAGRCLASGGPVRLPADLCLRRRPAETGFQPRVSLGTGCAGGAGEDTATVAAILELFERDAAALWWKGGMPARPISAEAGVAAGAGALLRQLRGDATTRHSWLLDITTDMGIPCVASVSLSRDGGGFACGLAAGLTIAPAIRSAIVEMCQMELSHHIVALKRRQRGEAALNRHDLAQEERARSIDADTPAIQPKGLPNDWRAVSDGSVGTEHSVHTLLRKAEGSGVSIYLVNLTRDRLAIPVSKVIATGLQPYPSEVETSRLKATIEGYDAGNNFSRSVPLL